MKVKTYPIGYKYKRYYPNLVRIVGLEGEAIFRASKNGKFYLIVDSGSLREFLDEDDLMDLIKIIEFDTETKLNNFVKERYGSKKPKY